MITVKFLCIFVSISLVEGKITRNLHAPPTLTVPFNSKASTPIWGNITQWVDHFSPGDKRTWIMRYLYNDECYKRDGPIFIYLGGEWSIRESSLMTGTVYDLACENNGYMLYPEHRFYGESYPTEDLSTENLKYLSADQALEDFAYFIKHVKENNLELENAKVVVIGGSYSATLATWARIKYPHLFDIAYASSAPVHAQVDFPEYYEVIATNIKLSSEKCYETVESAISQTETMLETGQGIENVSSLFNTCQIIKTTEPHRAFFFNSIGEVFASLVQYAAEGDIKDACEKIENYSGSDLEKLANYVTSTNGQNCIDSYDDFVNDYGSSELTTAINRQWFYQLCTEVSWLQTTTSNNQPFGDTFSLEFYYQLCKDLYGENFGLEVLNAAVTRTNLVYGSNTPAIKRLISFHGSVDPWHPMGILEDLHPYAISIVVDGASHCADLKSISDSDSDEMRRGKQEVRSTITKWLKEIEMGTASGKL